MIDFIIQKAGGGTINLYNKNSATLSTITNAEQSQGLNSDDIVRITVESAVKITFDIGDKMNILGRWYKINRLPTVKKTGNRLFAYNIELEGVQYDLARVVYDLTIDTTSNALQDVQADVLTGNLQRFATVLIANANRVFPGKWVLGDFPAGTEDKTLVFGETDNCLLVLQRLCSEYNTEFEIIQAGDVNTLHFRKAGQIYPYTFEYGKGKGLYSLERLNVSTSNIVTRLKVYGGTRNITAKYRAARLCLPGKTKGQSYIQKTGPANNYGIWEATKIFEHIYPKRTGTVTAIDSGNVLKLTDSTMNFDLNEKEADGITTKYLIDGSPAKIHFNTGNLSGYEFEIQSYDHATKTFTLKPFEDERGERFPSEKSSAFKFAVNDKYVLLDIALPQSYIDDAEEQLAEEGGIYYDQNSQPKVQYSLEVAEEFLKELSGAGSISNIFSVGDYIPVKDTDIDVDKSVRVQSFTRDLLNPFSYKLNISDTVTTNITNRVISELIEIDKITKINDIKSQVKARRDWRSAQELLDMVFDTEGDYYSEKIKPNSIETSMLAVGAKSTQFGLVGTVIQANYNGNKNSVNVKGGTLSHYAIEESGRNWTLADGTTTLTGDSTPYYIYAKCQKVGTAGSIIFSTSKITVDEDPSFYHFLIGVVNSVDPTLNVRSVALTYGFTTVNGKFIRTGRIQSNDGNTYFDLDTGEIGGKITFRSTAGDQDLGDWADSVTGDIQDTQAAANAAALLAQQAIDDAAELPKMIEIIGPRVLKNPDSGGTVSISLKVVKHNFSGSVKWEFLYMSYWQVTPWHDDIVIDWAAHSSLFQNDLLQLRCSSVADPSIYAITSIAVVRDGQDGEPGESGAGILSVTDWYAISTSGTTAPGTGWQTAMPSKPANYYLWNYEVITYTDGRTPTQTQKRVIQGKDARSIYDIKNAYAYSASDTVSPTSGWQYSIAALGAKPAGYFLWVREDIAYTDNPSNYIGTIGYVVKDGSPGEDGDGITGTTIEYAKSSSGATPPSSGWSTNLPSPTLGWYLWTRTTTTYKKSATTVAYSVSRYAKDGDPGEPGQPGTPGEDGKGVSSVVVWYYKSSSATTQTGGSWSTTKPDYSASFFLWTKVITTYTDNSTAETTPILDPDWHKVMAITDKFGVTIDGALIQAVMMLLREANSLDVTAGISGIRGTLKNNPSYWSGGTYAQAFALIEFLSKMSAGTTPSAGEYSNLAKIVMLHNGAGKYGDLIVEPSGRVVMVDPATGKSRLVFGVENIPTIATLLAGTVYSGSTAIGGGNTASILTLSGSTNVTKYGATATFNGTSISISASGKAQSNGFSSFAVAELYAYCNGVKTLALATAMVYFTNTVNYQNDLETVVVPVTSSYLTEAGTYTFKLEVITEGDIAWATAECTASSFAWSYTLQGVRRQQYGLDGMMFFYSDHHFHFTEGGGLDGRALPDKWNAPGVLLSASVPSTGGFSNWWGAKKHASSTATKSSVGTYIVYHSVGHTNYQVNIVPHSNRVCYVGTKTASQFTVYFYTNASSPSLSDTGFDFQIFGNNYNT